MAGKRRDYEQGDRALAREIIGRAIRPALRKKARRGSPNRLANLVLGSLFFVLGAAALAAFGALLWPSRDAPGFIVIVALVVPVFGGMALVGLSMLVQGVRNRPGSDGFFYRSLFRLARRMTPLQVTLLPLGVCLVSIVQGIATRQAANVEMGVYAALVWSCIFLQLFLHELGHFWAVRRVGFRFRRLAAGPVALVPRGSRVRVEANRKWLHLVVGAVYYDVDDQPSARDTLFVASAGPVVTAFIGLSALAAEDAFSADRGSLAYLVASANALIAAGTLAVNLLPLRFGSMESDGLQIWTAASSLFRFR